MCLGFSAVKAAPCEVYSRLEAAAIAARHVRMANEADVT